MQVVGGATSSISVTSWARVSVFVAFVDGSMPLFCFLFVLLPCRSFSWSFFWLVSCLILLLCKWPWYIHFCLLVFVFFGAVVRFFAPSVFIPIHVVPRTPSFPFIPQNNPLCSPWPSLHTCCFISLCACVANMCLPHPFIALFVLFLLPSVSMHPSAPIRTDTYPSAPIRTTFCQTHKNIMSGEISPAIAPQSWPARP